MPLDRRLMKERPLKYLDPGDGVPPRPGTKARLALEKLFFLALTDGLTSVRHGLCDYEEPLANRRGYFGRVGKRTDQEIVDGENYECSSVDGDLPMRDDGGAALLEHAREPAAEGQGVIDA